MMTAWAIDHDTEAGCAYFYVNPSPVRTTREVADSVLVDYNDDGEVVGIEIIDAYDRRSTPRWQAALALLADQEAE